MPRGSRNAFLSVSSDSFSLEPVAALLEFALHAERDVLLPEKGASSVFSLEILAGRLDDLAGDPPRHHDHAVVVPEHNVSGLDEDACADDAHVDGAVVEVGGVVEVAA